VSVEGVVWNCGGLVMTVGECKPTGGDGFVKVGNVGWYCELVMSPTCDKFTVMDWSCGWAIVVELIVVVWICGFATGSVGEVWGCGDCKPMSADGFAMVGWHCELVTSLTCTNGFAVVDSSCGLVTLAVVAEGSVGEVWGCGLWIVAGFGVVSETEGWAQSDARLCRSSIASTPISFMYII